MRHAIDFLDDSTNGHLVPGIPREKLLVTRFWLVSHERSGLDTSIVNETIQDDVVGNGLNSIQRRGNSERGSLVDLEASAVLSRSSSRPDTLHDLTVVIVRDNETSAILTKSSFPWFPLGNLGKGTDLTNTGFHLLHRVSKSQTISKTKSRQTTIDATQQLENLPSGGLSRHADPE
jgi:hypothetical protein